MADSSIKPLPAGAMSRCSARWRLPLPIVALAVQATILFWLPPAGGVQSRDQFIPPAQKRAHALIPAQEQNLALDLSILKPEVVQGESVPFVLTLSNAGTVPMSLRDGSPENRAFSIQVTGSNGFQASGDTASVPIREGEHVDAPRSAPRKTLGPGEMMTVDGDVISWIGDLSPGQYRVVARYSDSAGMLTTSKMVDCRVREALITQASLVRNLFLINEPFDTAWIQGSPGASDLFLLRSSPRYPPVSYSNRPVARLAGVTQAVASAYNIAGQAVRHLAWLSAGGELHVARITGSGNAGQPLAFPLASPATQIIAWPFTSEQGTFFAVLTTLAGDAVLFELPDGGRPQLTSLKQKLSSPRRILWCRDHTLILAGTGDEPTEIRITLVTLDRAPRKTDIRVLPKTPFPIIDISLAQRYRESDSGADRLAVLLCHDSAGNLFIRRRVDLGTGRIESEQRFPSRIATGMSLIDSVLDRNLTPRYLFAAADGSVHLVSPDFTRETPVVSPQGRSIRRMDGPVLMVASEFSKLPGTYVRYIDDRKRFAFAKVE
jgi:hypothetical protein